MGTLKFIVAMYKHCVFSKSCVLRPCYIHSNSESK